jgi:ureidoacrylate peracid hydrolase
MPTSFSSHHAHEDHVLLDPAHTAVLIVDMLNDFCTEGGAMVLPGAEKLYGPQNRIIEAARRHGAPIVHIVDRHRTHVRCDREFMKRTPHCMEGTWGAEIVSELSQGPEDSTVIKRRYSGFFNTDLDLTLKDHEVDTVIVMGVVTNICVRSTVHDAFFLGYRVLVPEDCVAATGPREQESSLFDIATHFGTVCDSASVAYGFTEGRPIAAIQYE